MYIDIQSVVCLMHLLNQLHNIIRFICRLVLETLKGTEKERTCYRMIGGVLVQRTVAEILPTLENSVQQVVLPISHPTGT